MGSSAKTGKKFFCRSQEQFLDKTVIWDRTPPRLYIKCNVYVWGRAQESQIFKWNSIISIHSKVIAFLVISLSPHGPHGPHVIPFVPTSSPSSPHHPHSPQKVPMWSPWLWSLWSPWSPPHVVPIVPVVPTSSLWYPCHPHCPHIIFTLLRRSSHHPQPPRYPLYSPATPLGVGGPESVKMHQI